jgi:hypothetical protein
LQILAMHGALLRLCALPARRGAARSGAFNYRL